MVRRLLRVDIKEFENAENSVSVHVKRIKEIIVPLGRPIFPLADKKGKQPCPDARRKRRNILIRMTHECATGCMSAEASKFGKHRSKSGMISLQNPGLANGQLLARDSASQPLTKNASIHRTLHLRPGNETGCPGSPSAAPRTKNAKRGCSPLQERTRLFRRKPLRL